MRRLQAMATATVATLLPGLALFAAPASAQDRGPDQSQSQSQDPQGQGQQARGQGTTQGPGQGVSGLNPTSEQAAEKRSTERAPRRRDATWREVFGGPFPSSRLFSMPTAEVIGAYQISLSGDASLLTPNEILTTSGVAAIGFGDIAQLEYRGTSAFTTLDDTAYDLPTLGVQLKVPYRAPRYVPELAVALRFGFPRSYSVPETQLSHTENTSDLYFVARLQATRRLVLHGGVRASQAKIESEALGADVTPPEDFDKILLLPALGVEYHITDETFIAAELARVPLFAPGDSVTPSDVRGGFFGRTGIRWRMLPWIIIDASIGYRIELNSAESVDGSMLDAFVDWDMRLGGEVFIPWGAVLCRNTGVLCE